MKEILDKYVNFNKNLSITFIQKLKLVSI